MIWMTALALGISATLILPSFGTAINNLGDIVGTADSADGTPNLVIWHNGQIDNISPYINSTLPFGGRSEIMAFSDKERILLSGALVDNQSGRTYLLTPINAVPLPAAIWSSLTAAPLVIFLATRISSSTYLTLKRPR
jgi:probable HAF family extracellular repeat protein